MSADRHLVTVDAFIQTISNVTRSTEVTCGDASLPFSDGTVDALHAGRLNVVHGVADQE